MIQTGPGSGSRVTQYRRDSPDHENEFVGGQLFVVSHEVPEMALADFAAYGLNFMTVALVRAKLPNKHVPVAEVFRPISRRYSPGPSVDVVYGEEAPDGHLKITLRKDSDA